MTHACKLTTLIAAASLVLAVACQKNDAKSPPTTQPTAPEEQPMSPASRQIPTHEHEPMSPPSDEPETVPEPAPHPDVPFSGDAGVLPPEPMEEPGMPDKY